ncbi:hypothetical protein HYH02_004043 [Chlamydomonas schloesseri]|uniref:Uncharacterized protein n=1 Tax=Chlamydomonas schloesseri TaxID=2026947 RepID=A0A836B9K2_9CHLO|nr:hypothetical protein HYH02_004043 [Chlamydomonas schloesseri]|eukprot:KAG2451445.1 hypothetical protein HYH02_004043 [Chlamydomonas schloesseri]
MQLQALRAAGADVPDEKLGDAFCTICKAANLLESGSTDELGLGAKVDQLSTDVGAINAKVDKLSTDMAAINEKVDKLSAMMVGIKVWMENQVHRNMNGMSQMADHNLQPLMAEAGEHVGKYPTQPALFPATLGPLFSLNNAQLDELEEFYARKFTGNSMAARQSVFAAFIGAMSARP